jgi:hypothetical protein
MRYEFNAGGLSLRHHPYIALITNKIRGFMAGVEWTTTHVNHTR